MYRPHGPRSQRGMFLPALVLLLAAAGLGWLLARQDSPASRDLAREMRTAQALLIAREALIGFAATYRNNEHPNADFGYLPCPDLDGDGSSETCGSKDQTSVGRLPYLTLNLPDLRDGAGECLWYAVSGSFKNNPKADTLNWDSTGKLRLLDANGLPLMLPGDEAGLAAAIVIAAGPPRPGQERSAGPERCGGDAEARNIAQYVEALGNRADNELIDVRALAGNDRIVTITTGEIYRQLKRRASYAPWLQRVFQANADCLAKPVLPAVVAPERHGPVELGKLPAFDSLSGPCRNETLRDAARNWIGTMRYARCVDGTDCLTGTGGRCRGAVIFGGERLTGPGAQRRAGTDGTPDIDQYLEPATLAALAAGQLAALPTLIALPFADRDKPVATDVALCIP